MQATPSFDLVEDQIKRHARESQKHTYTLFLVPRTSSLVTRILEEEGVLGDVTISTYNLQFIPLADDVISLEHDGAFREIWAVRMPSNTPKLDPSNRTCRMEMRLSCTTRCWP